MQQEAPQTYQTQPQEDERFYPSKVQKLIQSILDENLKDVEYEGTKAPALTEQLVSYIRAKVKTELKMPRYKIAIKVVLGEIKGQGVRVTSKCLWDVQFDNYASYSYANEKLYCVAIVYGCYFE